MVVLYKRWKKNNQIQLTKKQMDLNNLKWKIIQPESDPVTDPLGKTVDETGEKLVTT